MSLADALAGLVEISVAFLEYFLQKQQPNPDELVYINVLTCTGEVFSTTIKPYIDEFNLAAKYGPIVGCFYDHVGVLVLCFSDQTTNDPMYPEWKFL